ncbi:MAG: CPBP family intramembrane metalloprotease [Anaerolineae bacterium]|nr:CPBP family intramembrane metalloprotease [Anaerolineae bacterium]
MTTQTLTTNPNVTSSRPMAWAKRHPLVVLFALTYLFLWGVMLPQLAALYGLMPNIVNLPVDLLFGAFGPLLAALITVALAEGRAGIRDLVRQALRWRVGLPWYAVALLGPAAYMLAGGGLEALVRGQAPAIPASSMPLTEVATTFIRLLLLGMVLNTEEFAWRGVALPRLQTRYGALVGTLILAVVEGVVHLPLFWAPGSFFQQVGFGWWFAWDIALAILMTWVYNSTGRSVLLTTLLHASGNAWSGLLAPPGLRPYAFMVIILWLVTLLVVLVYGPRGLASRTETVETRG